MHQSDCDSWMTTVTEVATQVNKVKYIYNAMNEEEFEILVLFASNGGLGENQTMPQALLPIMPKLLSMLLPIPLMECHTTRSPPPDEAVLVPAAAFMNKSEYGSRKARRRRLTMRLLMSGWVC